MVVASRKRTNPGIVSFPSFSGIYKALKKGYEIFLDRSSPTWFVIAHLLCCVLNSLIAINQGGLESHQIVVRDKHLAFHFDFINPDSPFWVMEKPWHLRESAVRGGG